MGFIAQIAGEEWQAMAKLVKYFCRLFFKKKNNITAAAFFLLREIRVYNFKMAMCMCGMGHPAEFCPGNSDLVCAHGFVLSHGKNLGGKLRSPGSERVGGHQEMWLSMS